MSEWSKEDRRTEDVANEIKGERYRQKNSEGWTAEHDDAYKDNELVAAAMSYCLSAALPGLSDEAPTVWPWDLKWWKPKDRRRDLIRAAALIIAEIERTDRESESLPSGTDNRA